MTCSFNSNNLETNFKVGNPSFSFDNYKPTITEIPDRDGGVLTGSSLGIGTVTFDLYYQGTVAQRREALSTLAKYLDVDEPKDLVLPLNSWVYKAVPNGQIKTTMGANGDIHTVTFSIMEPAYGTLRSAVVPSGGSVSITVNGTYPTMPNIATNGAQRDTTSLLWGIKVDNGDFIHVKTGSNSARYVKINCSQRTSVLTASLTPNMPTLDSDWFVLAPGTHTVAMDQGTCSSDTTISWYERWL